MSKQSDFITRTRRVINQYTDWVKEANEIMEEWESLYNALIVEEDFIGSNLDIIPDGTRLVALTTAIGNISTILTNYDAGIDTNFERVT